MTTHAPRPRASRPDAPRPRTRPARVLSASLLSGALTLSGALAAVPAAAAPAQDPSGRAPGAASARHHAVTGAYLEEGHPGYFSSLHVVEDELPVTADYFTVEADFCVHPEARAGQAFGFDLAWEAPISDWESIVDQPDRYTSTVPVVDEEGTTLVTASMVHDLGAVPDDEIGFVQLKTAVDLELAPGAVAEGGCGTLTLPVPAPLAFTDGSLEPGGPGDEDPNTYIVEFIDPEGIRTSDSVTLAPSDFEPGQAWTDGIVDFTGSAQWALVTPTGPAAETTITLTGGELCDEPFETAILDSASMAPTNLEPDVEVSCEDGAKTFTLQNRLRADRQWVVVQADPRRGTEKDPATIDAEFVLDGESTTDSASVAAASSTGRMHGAWVPPGSCTVAPFRDIGPRTAFREPIRWMQCRGITGGYASDHTFRQSRSISRGESVAFLFRYAVTPDMIDDGIGWWVDPEFADLDEDAPFFSSVLWAANYGVTTGYADGTFRQRRPVTRGEFAAFLYRTAAATHPSAVPEDPGMDSGFADVSEAHPFATEIAWLREAGLTVGYSDGTFRAGRQISRGEVAGMLYRYHDGFVRRP
ncbi:MAG: S-layer homology domain-containing protein [Micrococcus sp.]|nr:S-layer homology domain-containing protein [Micrococcus sp.]